MRSWYHTSAMNGSPNAVPADIVVPIGARNLVLCAVRFWSTCSSDRHGLLDGREGLSFARYLSSAARRRWIPAFAGMTDGASAPIAACSRSAKDRASAYIAVCSRTTTDGASAYTIACSGLVTDGAFAYITACSRSVTGRRNGSLSGRTPGACTRGFSRFETVVMTRRLTKET